MGHQLFIKAVGPIVTLITLIDVLQIKLTTADGLEVVGLVFLGSSQCVCLCLGQCLCGIGHGTLVIAHITCRIDQQQISKIVIAPILFLQVLIVHGPMGIDL